MKAGVWCKAILNRAKEEVDAKKAHTVLFNRQSASLVPKYGDIDKDIKTSIGPEGGLSRELTPTALS